MRKYRFSELPASARRGIKSSPFINQEDLSRLRFGFEWVPLKALVEEVWSKFEDEDGHLYDHFGTFEDYHEWYKETAASGEYGWPPPWAAKNPDSLYAVILDGPPGGPYEGVETSVIKDGWHRFHWYVDQWGPLKLIPVVWSLGYARKS